MTLVIVLCDCKVAINSIGNSIFTIAIVSIVQASFHELSVALEWAATVSSAMAASTGCTRNAEGSSA